MRHFLWDRRHLSIRQILLQQVPFHKMGMIQGTYLKTCPKWRTRACSEIKKTNRNRSRKSHSYVLSKSTKVTCTYLDQGART